MKLSKEDFKEKYVEIRCKTELKDALLHEDGTK